MKMRTAMLSLLMVGTIARAQQPAEWRPNIAEDNKAATLEETMKFVTGTVNDTAMNQVAVPGDKHYLSVTTETFGAESTARCSMNWTRFQTVGAETAHSTIKADLAQVDPLSITVSRFIVSDKPNGFWVNFSGTSGNAFADVLLSHWPSGKFASPMEAKTASCLSGDKKCSTVESKIPHASLFFSDEETAHRVARALMHAALLCGGTKAVSPF
jgi:hypothetical protein